MMGQSCRLGFIARAAQGWLGLFLLVGGLVASAGATESRYVIPFQGAVALKQGQAALDSNTYNARFRLFTAATNGTQKYEETQAITIQNGVFSVELGGGSTTLNPTIIRDNTDLWLETTIDLDRDGNYETSEKLSPRIHLGAVPYAFFSQYAALATGLAVPADFENDGGDVVASLTEDGAFVSNSVLGTDNEPTDGAMYHDNVCLAWGYVDEDGSLLAGFGIDSVKYDSDNNCYVVTLYNGVENEDGYAMSVTVTPKDKYPDIAVYKPASNKKINVYLYKLDITSGGYLALTSDSSDDAQYKVPFSISVFGRPSD